jgi:hypothetical protein
MNPKDLTRQKKLEVLQKQHSILTAKKVTKKNKLAAVIQEITDINKERTRIGSQIFDLKNEDGDTPHITDHAIVRYLERVKGMNIWDIKSEIVRHRDAVRVDNTIVTVNGEHEGE